MRKIFMLGLIFLLLLSVFACRKDDEEPTDQITIRYAGWNLGTVEQYNIERRMIDAFMEANPNILVEIVERPRIPDPANPDNEIDMNWDEMLASMAATNNLPDVYMYATVPTAVSNGWAEDMTEWMENDPELNNIAEDIARAAVYGNRFFGVPQSSFYFGYFVNQNLFEEANLDSPSFGISWNDLLDLASEVATKPLDGTGIVGMSGVNNLYEWMPAQFDPTLGWFTFNEEGFHLDSDAFAQAMNIQRQFFGEENEGGQFSYIWEVSTVEQKVEWYSEGTGTQFEKGRHAILWGGSWDWGWIIPATQNEEHGLYNMNVDFIGTPIVVDGVQRIPVVLDYLVIGQGSEHPEEAYQLAKWMGFGKEGYLKRIEIATNHPDAGTVNFAPLQQDDELFDAYLSLFPAGSMTEFRKVLAHDSFIIEGIKTVPGYVNARWNGTYGTIGSDSYTIAQLLDAIRDGRVNLADVSIQLNNRINTIYQQARQALDQYLANN
jgi:multiple sugar transport system substrate-binding protein